MNPIIYIDGELADAIGKVGLKALGDTAAILCGKPVDVLTHGETKYHGDTRLTVAPRADQPSTFLRKLDCLLAEAEDYAKADRRKEMEDGLRAAMAVGGS